MLSFLRYVTRNVGQAGRAIEVHGVISGCTGGGTHKKGWLGRERKRPSTLI